MTDQTIPDDTTDTDAPPPEPSHGWLEQFEALSHKAIEELKPLIVSGILPAENDILIHVAAKLISLAQHHDPEALSKVEALL